MDSRLVRFSVLLVVGAGCARRQFPVAEPMTRDTDMVPVSVRCYDSPTKDDPKHRSCAPRLYVSPLVWDGADNAIFRPLAQALALERDREAVNVNSFDEVPDSAWFTNKIGTHEVSLDEVRQGVCEDAQIIDDTDVKDATWLIDAGKANGSTPGFRVRIPGKGKYLFKSDIQDAGVASERPSASSTIGSRIYALLGFNTSCEQVVYVKASAFELKNGLTYSDNTLQTHKFDRAALDKLFEGTAKRGEYMRFLASAWLPGHLIGPFRYHGTRSDDPNDVIAHEQRRDLRGGRLVAAWMNHFDSREQNSMDSWIASDPQGADDASPGYVRHYYLDTSDALGAEWVWDLISRRLGFSYVLDWGDIAYDFVTVGIPLRRWDTTQRTVGYEAFGYFNGDEFQPETWKSIYQNPTFSAMSERDGAWIARKMAYITPDMVRALAETGELTDSALTDYLTTVLQARLDKIVARYLTKLSPVARVVATDEGFCAVDVARMRKVHADTVYRYSAHLRDDVKRTFTITTGDGGQVCVNLDHASADAQPYFIVRLSNGVAPGPLDVHLYSRGEKRFRVVGLERPEP